MPGTQFSYGKNDISPWQELIRMCSLFTAPEVAEFDPRWDVDLEDLR